MSTLPATQRVVRLRRVPCGAPVESDFELGSAPLPAPNAGEVLVRTLWLSLDPYVRSVLSGRHLGERFGPGDIVIGQSVAEVVASEDRGFRPGDLVLCETGWREYTAVPGANATRIDPTLAPISTALGVLGMPGLTAWAGINTIAHPCPGETFVVSAASGPVGATAGQLARLAGCRAVGIAGSEAKCRFVVDELGFDTCIDYKREDFATRLAAACPRGIDMYFDNVGGRVLETCLGRLARGARIVLCGLIDQYNLDTRPPGPNLGPVIGARATMTGLVVYDHFGARERMLAELVPLVRSGKLRYREDVSEGLESAPAAFARLMRGENFGKALVRVAAQPGVCA